MEFYKQRDRRQNNGFFSFFIFFLLLFFLNGFTEVLLGNCYIGHPAAAGKNTSWTICRKYCSFSCIFGGCCLRYLPDANTGPRHWRPIPLSKCRCQSTTLSEQPYTLFLFCLALFVCWIKPGKTWFLFDGQCGFYFVLSHASSYWVIHM